MFFGRRDQTNQIRRNTLYDVHRVSSRSENCEPLSRPIFSWPSENFAFFVCFVPWPSENFAFFRGILRPSCFRVCSSHPFFGVCVLYVCVFVLCVCLQHVSLKFCFLLLYIYIHIYCCLYFCLPGALRRGPSPEVLSWRQHPETPHPEAPHKP